MLLSGPNTRPFSQAAAVCSLALMETLCSSLQQSAQSADPCLLTVTLKRPYKSPAFRRAQSNNTVGLGPAVWERKKKGLLWPAIDVVKVALLANNIVFMCCVVIQIISTPQAEREAATTPSSSNCASTPILNKSRPPSLLCDPCADLLRCTWWVLTLRDCL